MKNRVLLCAALMCHITCERHARQYTAVAPLVATLAAAELVCMAPSYPRVRPVCHRPYFGRIRFDMSYWVAGFPADALAFTCITFCEPNNKIDHTLTCP